MESRSTFVFAGGGTGGHLFPGIAVALELLRRDPHVRLVFAGSTRSIESTIVAEQGFEHRTLPAEPSPMLKRNPIKFAWNNWQAFWKSTRLLRELRPSAVIGLGGFASAPVVFAANRQGIPVILLEGNVVPGRTTRWLSRFADQICVTFAATATMLSRNQGISVTGNAVRKEIAALQSLGPADRRWTTTVPPRRELLILGGSQGADSLNEAVLLAVGQLRDALGDWTMIHQTGPRQVDQVRKAYQDLNCSATVESFFNDLPRRYATASLVISRAGASTLTELACAGIPMILLPYPQAADDHQRANAQAFVAQSAALTVEHAATADLTGQQLAGALKQLVDHPGQCRSMGFAAKKLAAPDAAELIADVIHKAILDKQCLRRIERE